MWMYNNNTSTELYHHGIKGQRWGIRRFQNEDGSLTPLGKKRYLTSEGTLNRKGQKKFVLNSDGTYADRKSINKERKEEDSLESRRQKVLKSNDPSFILKNKDLLTTKEIDDKITRITTEQKLAKAVAESKNDTTALKMIDSKLRDLHTLASNPLIKQAASFITGKPNRNYLTLEEAIRKRDKLSSTELQNVIDRENKKNTLSDLLRSKNRKGIENMSLDDVLKNSTRLSTDELQKAANRAIAITRVKQALNTDNKSNTKQQTSSQQTSSQQTSSQQRSSFQVPNWVKYMDPNNVYSGKLLYENTSPNADQFFKSSQSIRTKGKSYAKQYITLNNKASHSIEFDAKKAEKMILGVLNGKSVKW